MKEFLNINNLSVSVDEKNIINNLNLKINQRDTCDYGAKWLW